MTGRLILAVVFTFALGFLPSLTLAQADKETPAVKKPPTKGGDLDDDILKLLTDDAAAELGPVKKGEEKPEKEVKPLSELDKELVKDLEEDEPLSEENPLLRAGQRMRQSEQRISLADAGSKTQELQGKIVEDLDELLKALQKNQQKQQPSGQKPTPQQSQRSDPKQPQQQPDQNAPNPNGERKPENKPAQESTDQATKGTPEKVEAARPIADLLRDVWGHLPERDREVLIQASLLQYLPEYQQMIEDYYSRLARPQASRP